MRQMLDMYLTADPSRVMSKLGDASLLQLIVENGIEFATDQLSDDIKTDKRAVAETIENNMRRTIIQEMPINPAYYEKMSVLLVELIRLRKEGAIEYEESLKRYEVLAREIQPEAKKDTYPQEIDTSAKRALYDNLDKEEKLTILMDKAVIYSKHDNWIGHSQKEKHLKNQVVKPLLEQYQKTEKLDPIIEIIKQQTEYK
jgi:type I restriction enzyme R subunit